MNGRILVIVAYPDFQSIVSISDRFDSFLTNMSLGMDRAYVKTQEQQFDQFIHLVEKKHPGSLQNKSLIWVIRNVTEAKNPELKASLYKKEGYFRRLFSNESWEEWVDHRTALGKVIHIFAAFLEGSSISDVSRELLYHAAEESSRVIKRISSNSCQENLLLGGIASLTAKNPLPMTAAMISCVDIALAAPPRRVTTLNGAHGPHGLSRRQAILKHTQQRKADAIRRVAGHFRSPVVLQPKYQRTLIDELLGWLDYLPSVFKKISTRQKEEGIAKAIIYGIFEASADHFQLNDPVNELSEAFKEMEHVYWLNILMPHYILIFPSPQTALNDRSYEIKMMKETLKDNGYLIGGVQTPLQFVQYLNEKRICGGGWCQLGVWNH